MGLRAVYSATLDAHLGQIFIGLPSWCSGLKGFTPQVGGSTTIQPHSLGSNPAWAKQINECIKLINLVSGS